jgi:hypothetical protein
MFYGQVGLTSPHFDALLSAPASPCFLSASVPLFGSKSLSNIEVVTSRAHWNEGSTRPRDTLATSTPCVFPFTQLRLHVLVLAALVMLPLRARRAAPPWSLLDILFLILCTDCLYDSHSLHCYHFPA